MTLLYVLTGLAVIQGIVALVDGIRAARYMRRGAHLGDRLHAQPTKLPSVQVFCPCRGVDAEFDKNIRSILDQDYPRFEVHFVVESADDPAFTILQREGATNIFVAGEAVDCGQKVHNLRRAVSEKANADVLVFCDSDARYPRYWLSDLTAPLAGGDLVIATGYRWYVAGTDDLPTLLRSVWNASIVSMLGGHQRNFAWGGATALRRQTFDKLRILQAWSGSVSDDYAITRAAEHAGARIVFVPSCLIPSYGECSWRELLEFTCRQITITRVYHPKLWTTGFVAQTLFTVTLLGLTLTLPFSAVSGIGWIVLFSLAAAKSTVRLGGVRSILSHAALSKHTWFYILSSPVVALLFEYNMIRSALSRDIVWRQIRYSLISPNKTLVSRPRGSGDAEN